MIRPQRVHATVGMNIETACTRVANAASEGLLPDGIAAPPQRFRNSLK